MSSELNVLNNRRGTIKGQLKRFWNFVKGFQNNGDVNQLKVRRSKAEENWEEFQRIQQEIEAKSEELTTTEDPYRIEFENLYFEAVSECEKLLEQKSANSKQNETENNSNTNLRQTSTSTSNMTSQSSMVKLAALNVPEFSGDYKKWATFHDMFVALIHANEGLTDVQRFFYLKSALTGDAAKVVQSFETSEQNYATAWNCLTERYNNKRILVQNHTKAIFDLKPIDKESSAKLRNFIDSLFGHTKALEALGYDTNNWGPLLVHLISTKLDTVTLREWETQAPKRDVSEVSKLMKFLLNRFQILEAVEGAQKLNFNPEQKKQQFFLKGNKREATGIQRMSSAHTTTTKTTRVITCYACDENHPIYRCEKFLALPIPERKNKIAQAKICVVCLAKHDENKCRFKGCRKCGEQHNTLLHESNENTENSVSISTHATRHVGQTQVLLSTAIVKIQSKSEETFFARALMDSGSQSNFMTNELANKLQLSRQKVNCTIAGINKSTSRANFSVRTTIQSREMGYKREVQFLTLNKITTNLPAERINTSKIMLPNYVKLADPSYAVPGNIDILIGAECFYDILRAGKYKSVEHGIIYQETSLGWIAAGTTLISNVSTTAHSFFTKTVEYDDLSVQMEKFWQLEEISTDSAYSVEEKSCIEHFEKTVTRDETGRFVVELPLRKNYEQLGDSREIALRRFLAIENRFRNNSSLRENYVKFMTEYEKLNHMAEASNHSNLENKYRYYMPHHAVVRKDSATTKTRVVFDASCPSTKITSLNDVLMKGPVIQEELVCIIARFRTHKFVLSADVEKMYRQIRVAKKHQPFQKILWRSSPDQKIKEYLLQTVTYGTTPASYLATACLKKLAEENKEKFPEASRAIKSDFYMDDYLGGANTIDEASELRNNIITIMNSAGFSIRKWISNEPALLTDMISNTENDPMYVLNIDSGVIKTLGLSWCPRLDTYQYKLNKLHSNYNQIASKRNVLSTIATIYDPLGLIGPVVVSAKIIMQQLWQRKISWDEQLPENLKTEWETYKEELSEIEKIKIPRRIIGVENVDHIEIHGFADASERAYGACIYIRATDIYGAHSTRLIAAKSRIAPLKIISLARLELCAAVLLVRITKKIVPCLRLKINNYYFWSDSTIVLAWLRSPSSRWKTFVAHRVGEIHEDTSATQWSHVKSEENPADIISRGCNPNQLKNNILWWEGPAWMKTDRSEWKTNTTNYTETARKEELEEKKKTITTAMQTKTFHWFEKYSSLMKLLRITSYLLRWKRKTKNKNKPVTSEIDVDEIDYARIKLIKLVQLKYFECELKNLKKLKCVSRKSKLFLLNPFLDENEIIRVGGRLNKSKIIHSEKKNPIVLPAQANLTLLIFRYEHVRLLHAGPQALLAAMREKYWPINGRNSARKIVHECVTCFRTKPSTYQPILGDLPAARIDAQERAFYICGVDFAGPIEIKYSVKRNASRSKGYICVFVCFVSKAVHIELVSDLTTNAFIAALRRFWARRGICKTIYSDNATNFIGANRQLKEVRNLFSSEEHLSEVRQCSAELGVQWKFIPPRSPHFGGLWEAAIKSVKSHLSKTLGNAALTYEETNTILVRIEACLNSRPITPLSSDPSDLNALTPGHFLVGGALTESPEIDVSKVPINRLRRWQRTTQLVQQIWQRWSREYLSQLQERTKWTKSKGPPLQMGSMVLLKEKNLPPLSWRLGRVVGIQPDKDGEVRVATVRTERGEIQRAARMLCPLPMEQENVKDK